MRGAGFTVQILTAIHDARFQLSFDDADKFPIGDIMFQKLYEFAMVQRVEEGTDIGFYHIIYFADLNLFYCLPDRLVAVTSRPISI